MSVPEALLPLHLDSTMLTTFRSCPRKFYWEFVLGLRPAHISVDLHFGAVFASSLEHLYRLVHEQNWPVDLALASAMSHASRQWGDFVPPEKAKKTFDRLLLALDTYVQRYGVLTDHIQPYLIDGRASFEFTFAIPLTREATGLDFPLHPSGDPFLFCGRYDLLGEMNGLPIIRDEKTASALGPTWADKWDLRGQFLGYIFGSRVSGINVSSVCVRGIAILTNEITHQEVTRPYSNYLVDLWLQQTAKDVHRMVRAFDEGYFDYNFGDSCSAYGRCPFTSLCQSPSPEPWFSEYSHSRWNPLHRNPIAEKDVA